MSTGTRRQLTLPVAGSLGLHAAAAALALYTRGTALPPSPPSYRVSIVAAPAGPRAEGVVRAPTPATPTRTRAAGPSSPSPVPPVPSKAVPPKAPAAPLKSAPITAPRAAATPPPPRAAMPTSVPAMPKPTGAAGTATNGAPPTAGGGPVGGSGTDVATVRTEGTDFPYPLYLTNIVRQIALNFPTQSQSLTAEVRFLVHRDGTVSDVTVVRRSGNYRFDFDARGSVEAASKNFGRLPDGFHDDVLPVLFSFDPRVFRR